MSEMWVMWVTYVGFLCLLCGYFREELQQSRDGRGVCPRKPPEGPAQSQQQPCPDNPHQLCPARAPMGPLRPPAAHSSPTSSTHFLPGLLGPDQFPRKEGYDGDEGANQHEGVFLVQLSCEEGGGSWAGPVLGRARVGMAASGHPSLLLAPPTDLPQVAAALLEATGPSYLGVPV